MESNKKPLAVVWTSKEHGQRGALKHRTHRGKRHQKGEKRTSKDIGPPRTLSAEATILSATASVISAASQAYAIKKSMPTESELDAVRGAMRAANLR